MLYLICPQEKGFCVCVCVSVLCVYVCPFGEQTRIIGENMDLEGRERKKRNFDHQLIWSGSCIMNDAEEADWLSKPSAKAVTVKKVRAWIDTFAYWFMD